MSDIRTEASKNFIQAIIDQDVSQEWNQGRVHTRFPPEPNGFLHIGHAKAALLNYSLAVNNEGLFNLRFDDTNPLKEEEAFVESILSDLRWLGADWENRLFFASDYFEHMYDLACGLIAKGRAYVCDLDQEQIRAYRGTLTEPGKESPYRNRSVQENLDLFSRMRNGEFSDGQRTLRAKIDMSSPNLNMRDPVLYRILHAHHHRTKDKWCIYPMYDYAHPLGDALENITHSVCSLEYADHRPLYDWVLDHTDYDAVPGVVGRPKQIEFARLNMNYTVMSKRKLRRLVTEGHVEGWDDPRMPTLAGLRKRGYTPRAIRRFSEEIGVAKRDSVVDLAFLEHCIRQELNRTAPRFMAVLRPLKLVITNYDADVTEWVEVENNPEDPQAGTRNVPFGRELYIEEADFMEDPPKKFFRLAPGREVRLKGAYIIKCEEVIKDEVTGDIRELRCSYDPDTRSGEKQSSRKVKATIHWVSTEHATRATVRLYDHLFQSENPERYEDFIEDVNPRSLETLTACVVEPALTEATDQDRFQFLRQGYFFRDRQDEGSGLMVFNRIVGLRDTWAKTQQSKEKR